MKKQILMSLILASSIVSVAHAADEVAASENTSSVKVSDVQKSEEKVGDIDDEITNAKMRAESGSKSKWSMSADLTYSGGNVERPFSAERPNYAGEAATPGSTRIDGTVGVSYRVDKKNRISVGTGIGILTPFQARGEDITRSSEEGGATEISTPYVTWGHAGKIGETQNSLSVSWSHATSSYEVNDLQSVGSASMSHVAIFNIEGSNWQPGLSTSLVYSFYKDDAQATDVIGNGNRRLDYQVGFYPFVEYAFNDRYSFRTVVRALTYSHMRSDAGLTFERSLYTQSMGIGIAVTRDIFLYPNLQFAPENLKPELTNVGLSTTLNVF